MMMMLVMMMMIMFLVSFPGWWLELKSTDSQISQWHNDFMIRKPKEQWELIRNNINTTAMDKVRWLWYFLVLSDSFLLPPLWMMMMMLESWCSFALSVSYWVADIHSQTIRDNNQDDDDDISQLLSGWHTFTDNPRQQSGWWWWYGAFSISFACSAYPPVLVPFLSSILSLICFLSFLVWDHSFSLLALSSCFCSVLFLFSHLLPSFRSVSLRICHGAHERRQTSCDNKRNKGREKCKMTTWEKKVNQTRKGESRLRSWLNRFSVIFRKYTKRSQEKKIGSGRGGHAVQPNSRFTSLSHHRWWRRWWNTVRRTTATTTESHKSNNIQSWRWCSNADPDILFHNVEVKANETSILQQIHNIDWEPGRLAILQCCLLNWNFELPFSHSCEIHPDENEDNEKEKMISEQANQVRTR